MRLGALLDDPELRLRLLTGSERLDREVRQTITTDLLDPSRFLSGGELVLTGLMWWQHAGDTERFVATIADAGVAGLVVGAAGVDGLPDELVPACERHGLPLFEVPVDFNFAVITEHVVLALAAERRLPFPADADLAGSLAAVSAELGATCRVLAPTGRLLAGPATDLGRTLARHFVSGEPLSSHTLMPSPGLSSWFVAVDGDGERWSASQRRLVDRLVELVSAQRTAWMSAVSASGSVGDEVFVLASRDADVLAELAALLAADIRLESDDLTYAHVPTLGRTLAEAAAEITAALHVLEHGLGTARLAVGLSSTGTSEAADAYRLASHRAGTTTLALDTELTSHHSLLAVTPDEVRTIFAQRLLGPIYAYDQEHRSSLAETLRVFLECNGSWSLTAERLHVHVNTLRYRLRRVEELTGRDLARFADRVDFYVALAL